MDSTTDVTGNKIGLGIAKRLPGSSPQQVKLKFEPLSSAALYESEESGVAETKSKDRGKNSDDMDEKVGQNVQKLSTLILSSQKNKPMARDDLGDGVRRQGRTGRGFTSTRFLMPMTEKLGGVGTTKQLRSARLGFDKTERNETKDKLAAKLRLSLAVVKALEVVELVELQMHKVENHQCHVVLVERHVNFYALTYNLQDNMCQALDICLRLLENNRSADSVRKSLELEAISGGSSLKRETLTKARKLGLHLLEDLTALVASGSVHFIQLSGCF